MAETVTTARYRDTATCLGCGRRFPRVRASKLTCSDACRQARVRALRAATPPLPEGKFELILADPPWSFRTYSKNHGPDHRHIPYETMDLPAICRLPVAQLAAPDAVLAIWLNSAETSMAGRVAKAWGFGEPYEGFVWFKVSRAGTPHFGLGYSTRKDTESLWLAKRGKGIPVCDHGVAQTIIAQRREHSRKPDEAYRRLERLYGDVRRLELFNRRARAGWTRWGNELLPPDAEQMLPFKAEEMEQHLRLSPEPAPAS